MDTNITLDGILMTDKLFDMMYEAKRTELQRVCDAYKCGESEFKSVIHRKLVESNMHLGACNLALSFLIIDTDKGTMHSTYTKAMAENILGAAVYYANGCGKDPTLLNR